MHLLLDLVREYLVLEMVDRDNRGHTNIHRYGDNEELPDALRLSQIDERNPQRVFDYIGHLAYAYDQQLVSGVAGYTSRYPAIREYIEVSKAHLWI